MNYCIELETFVLFFIYLIYGNYFVVNNFLWISELDAGRGRQMTNGSGNDEVLRIALS